jgi:glycosyltransferase involved in cell wall biosynthesis
MWEDIHAEILERSGQDWDLLAAGSMRDPNHLTDYQNYREQLEVLEKKGLAHYFEFIPRGEIYYKVMAICDFIVLPSTDETQSGTLARIIALNKPYVTTAPMEGLTAQTLESEGGLLFTTKKMLRDQVVTLACDEELRLKLGENLKKYLDQVVSWELVAKQYNEAYELASQSVASGQAVEFPLEF